MIFVVPCRYDPTRPTILDCVQSIRKYHPDDSIVVVDSDSPDKSYFNDIKDITNLTIEDCANKNYIYGALWKAYERHDSDYYYLFHDSMFLKSNVSFLKDKEIGSTRYFRSWNGVGGIIQSNNLYGHSNGGVYRYGCDNQVQKEWFNNRYNSKRTFFNGLFGSSFVGSKSVLDFMIKNEMQKILPTCKNECQAMERLLGSFFTDNSLNFWENCLLGEHHDNPFENKHLKKELLARK